jgi:hypothetical protein
VGKRGHGARYARGSSEALKRTPYDRSPTKKYTLAFVDTLIVF